MYLILFLQLLRPLDNCPAYHKLSMADKETAEYKEIEKLSQVLIIPGYVDILDGIFLC